MDMALDGKGKLWIVDMANKLKKQKGKRRLVNAGLKQTVVEVAAGDSGHVYALGYPMDGPEFTIY